MTTVRAAGVAVLLLVGACSHEEANTDDAAVNIDAAANAATVGMANADRPAPRTPSPAPNGTATATPLAAPDPIENAGTEADDGGPSATSNDTDLPPRVSANYRCVDGSRYTVRFDNRADTATLVADGKTLGTLVGQRPASGMWYKGDGWELRGKGRQATLTKPDGPALPCIS